MNSRHIGNENGNALILVTVFLGPLSLLPTPLPAGATAAVRVTARKTIQMLFAGVVGFKAMRPRVESIAVAGRAQTALKVVPWAICDDAVPNPVQCTLVTIKYT